jgi:biotin carboxylase
MVEEFVPGPQISTETILWSDRHATPGFADRNYELLERFRPQIMENGGWVPSALDASQRVAIEEVAAQAARALGIEAGVAKGDIVLGPEGPVVIEIAARLSGGDFCESLVPLGTGVNYVREAIRIAMGQQPDFEALAPRWNRAVANRYLFPEPGRLVRVEGEEEVRAQPWVHKLELNYAPGETIPPTESHAHRFGVFVVSGEDRREAQERVEQVYSTLSIVTQ